MSKYELKTDLLQLRELWRQLPNYACWFSSPDNPRGLRLTPVIEPGRLWLELEIDKSFTSFPGIAHGGYSYTILDGLMGWYILAHYGRAGVATQTATFYRAPLLLGRRYRFEAVPDEQAEQVPGWVAMAGRVFDPATDPEHQSALVEIRSRFYLPSREQATRILGIQLEPGAEELFPAEAGAG